MPHPLDQDTTLPAQLHVAAQHLTLAMRIANRAVVEDLETYAHEVKLPGETTTWHDTRPMLDPREHAPIAIDMAVEALAYAEQAELIVRHPAERHLVRISRAALLA
jgi:hypothetical protein